MGAQKAIIVRQHWRNGTEDDWVLIERAEGATRR